MRGAARRGRRGAAPRARVGVAAAARPRPRRTRALPLHGQQRAVADGRGAGGGAVRRRGGATSAGSHPKPLHPDAVRVMRARGSPRGPRSSRSPSSPAGASTTLSPCATACARSARSFPAAGGDPLERPRPGARAGPRRRDPAGLRAHGRRARDARRLPARGDEPHHRRQEVIEHARRVRQRPLHGRRRRGRRRLLHHPLRLRAALERAPAFADVTRGRLRLLLSGPASSAGRPMPDGRTPEPGGWNRIHLIVEDLAGEVEQLRGAGLRSATTSSAARAAGRSCSTTPPATRSSSSSPPAPRDSTASRRHLRLESGGRRATESAVAPATARLAPPPPIARTQSNEVGTPMQGPTWA